MITVVDISLIVGIAAALTFISAILVLYLLKTTTEKFRLATYWYAASTASLIVAVLGVLGMPILSFTMSAVAIIGGAHFGIIFAYAAVRQVHEKTMWWKPVLAVGLVITVLQGTMAYSGANVIHLMISSSLINGSLAVMISFDLFRRFHGPQNKFAVLFGWPFLVVGIAYLTRLLIVLAETNDALMLVSTAVIAFGLGIASMYWGFILIIQREAELNLQLKEARQKAEVVAQQQARFFAQMNHEIRTPLNGVLGITELLKQHVREGEGEALLRELNGSGQLLLSIVSEVLEYSKASAGKIELESLPIDLEELLDNVTSQHRRVALSKNIQLSLHVFPANMAPVLGDPTRINQILQNLLSNALKFTRAGEVSVTVTRDADDLVVITVRDMGIGMTKEQVDHLFVPFQQAAADITRRYGGTGLGMSIVRMLVEAMQGQIHVESEPGRGTAITVALPLPEARLTESRRAADEVETGWVKAFTTLQILCADDDPINRLVLEALLEGYGVQPAMAEDGFEAVALAEGQSFDAYIIDISMPGMDGVETLATLRELDAKKGRSAPLAIAATAHVMSEDVETYLAAGFDAHLPKPIRREDLEAVLQSALMRNAQTV